MTRQVGQLTATAFVAVTGVAALVLGATTGSIVAGVAAVLTGALLAYVSASQAPVSNSPLDLEPQQRPASGAAIQIAALADPVLLIDDSSRIVGANAVASDLFGERIVGEMLALSLRHPAALEAVRLAREQGGTIEREIAGVGRQHGLYRLRVADAGEGRLLLSFTDISQARLIERMRIDFVANASHELRTPLATILGFVETLQGPAAEDASARQRFLGIMWNEANRMTRLIDDLLSLSRIELDKYVRPTTAIELRPLLAEVGKTLSMRLDEDRRILTIDAPEELPRVVGDRDQILQVLHNLLSNALKYGRTGTPIVLRTERADSSVRISVTDEGEGIAPEHLPRLTERFYRVDNSRSRSLGGTGLGLAIVKHIVERHRGLLTIDSEVGVGTTVSFTLPQVPLSQK